VMMELRTGVALERHIGDGGDFFVHPNRPVTSLPFDAVIVRSER
jgi:hypothetical protein